MISKMTFYSFEIENFVFTVHSNNTYIFYYSLPIWVEDFLFCVILDGVSLSLSLSFSFICTYWSTLDCDPDDPEPFDGRPAFDFSFFLELLEVEVEVFELGVLLLLEAVTFKSEFRGFDNVLRFGFDDATNFSNSAGFSNNSWWYFNSSTALVRPAVFFI